MNIKMTKVFVLMTISGFILSLYFLLIQQLPQSIDFNVLMFFRFFIPGLLILVLGVFTQMPKISLEHKWLHISRAITSVISQYCLFYYLQHGLLLNGTLLFLTSPLFVPLINRVCFKKHHSIKQYLSIAIAFAGVVLVLHPGANLFTPLMLIGICSGLFNACAQIAVHNAAKDEEAMAISLWMFSLCALFALLLGFIHHERFMESVSHVVVNPTLLLVLVGISGLSILNQNLRTRAYGLVNKAVSISPFVYLSLIFSVVLDMVVYNHYPHWLSITGIVVIGISVIMMLVRFHKQSK